MKPASSPGPEGEVAEAVALTLEGAGILAPGGKRVLVPGVLAGEQVRFQRRRRRRNYDEGVLLEVLTASPQRVMPDCRYFGTCGGCALQHLSADGQVELKQATLLDSLTRIGGLSPGRVLPPVRGASWGYRRRARLAVRDVPRKGRVLVGFREAAKPWVADMLSCATVHASISRLIPALSELAGRLSLRARLPQVEATVADNALALVIRVLAPPDDADLDLLRCFARDHQVRLYLQPGNTETVRELDGEGQREELHYEIPAHGLRLEFGPTDFIQVHREVNLRMIDQALELLDPGPNHRVLDLYCGIGNFTLPLARRAGAVLGVEGARAAVQRATGNASGAGLSNCRFVEADLAGAGTEGAWTRERFDLALLDPPRTGAAELLPALAGVSPRRIVYVSCHPGTLARDAGLLAREHGYALVAAGIMDMFPQTGHVESMALFERE